MEKVSEDPWAVRVRFPVVVLARKEVPVPRPLPPRRDRSREETRRAWVDGGFSRR